jgi:hypothetical protein
MGMNALITDILGRTGINPERFSLQWASAAEAPRFVKLITDFTGRIKKLGPLGQAEGIEPAELQAKIAKAIEVAGDRKVRMFYGNAVKAIRKEAVFTAERINEVIAEKTAKTVEAAFAAPAGGAGEGGEGDEAMQPAAQPKKKAVKKKG